LEPTLSLFAESMVQLREHGFEGVDCLIIALCSVKGCMLQFVATTRQRIEFNDLCISNISTNTRTMTDCLYLFRVVKGLQIKVSSQLRLTAVHKEGVV
jgi:hypothetical protein